MVTFQDKSGYLFLFRFVSFWSYSITYILCLFILRTS